MVDGDNELLAEKVQRFRFRVVAPDGRELLSDVAHVRFPSPPFRVTSIFVAAKSSRLGAIKSEGTGKTSKDQFAALSLDYELRTPRDASTGQASGKRQHSPVSIVKEWGAASPQLFQALVNNEVLETVDIDCYGVVEGGKNGLVHKLKLTNAFVCSIQQRRGGDVGDRDLETVAFTFQQIEHLSPAGAVLASDHLQSGS
jgi:type VI secretion system secreted protein Hcp